MQNLHIPAIYEQLPEVLFNAQIHKLSIAGVCIPEDSEVFFESILKWLDAYLAWNQGDVTFKFQIVWFHDCCIPYFSKIFEKLSNHQKAGKGNVLVQFYHYEEDYDYKGEMLDWAEQFDFKNEFIAYQE